MEVLHIEAGNGSAVAVIDARTEAAKKVEHKMSGSLAAPAVSAFSIAVDRKSVV